MGKKMCIVWKGKNKAVCRKKSNANVLILVINEANTAPHKLYFGINIKFNINIEEREKIVYLKTVRAFFS